MTEHPTIDPELTNTVRELLLNVWLKQACLRAADRPNAQEALLGFWGPLVDEAVTELARLFADGPPDDDPAQAVWRVFPRLDRHHSAELARLLTEARGSSMRGAP